MASDSDSTVIVVFVSLGGFCFLAFVLFALCCFIKYRKKASQEADNVRVDEHVKIKEDIVEGPHGTKAVVLTIEDDVHIEEDIRKNEKFGEGMNARSAVGIDVAESSSGSGH
ncbi:protein TRACHEARY ELEMENT DIFFERENTIATION-RELATED 7A [Apium graveolens]|uniref:protein TRACHEARY ELEMENT DIFFERENTIATION-RELATED 7A n=1 Tax=Apium graveolens TaxID=4045 RepID=UPI003D7BD82E